MNIGRVWDSEKQLKSITGLSKSEVGEIIEDLKFELQALGRFNTERGGRPSKLDIKGNFLMVMLHFRHYLPFEAIGAIFDLDESNVKRWIDDTEDALSKVLEKKSLLHLLPRKIVKEHPRYWSQNGKFTLMVPSNQYDAQKINALKEKIIQEKRSDTLLKYLF